MGAQVFTRVSELAFVRGQPKAILRWIDSAGIRTPLYAELDMKKIRRIRRRARVAFYDGTTLDPSDVAPQPPQRGKRRKSDAPRPGGRRRTDPPLTPALPG